MPQSSDGLRRTGSSARARQPGYRTAGPTRPYTAAQVGYRRAGTGYRQARPGTAGRARPARRRQTATRLARMRTPGVDRRRAGVYSTAARARLRRFRQGSALAVAITALVLLLWGSPEAPAQGVFPAVPGTSTASQGDPAAPPPAETSAVLADTAALVGDTGGSGLADTAASEVSRSVEEATGTMRDLAVGFSGLLPKIFIALLLLAAAALLARMARPLLRSVLGNWEKAEALSALAGILVWLVALGAALSVIAGDARALIGSVGLFGLALSWALQTPIESFTGWLLNSFRGYYRVGDRVAVGDVFGDVYRIDFLTTTVWEAGGPEKPVQGAQPTGALITFPNAEVLRSNVVNYTRDFPFVWDEVTVGVTNESDLGYAMSVVRGVADRVVGEAMLGPIEAYQTMLERAGLAFEVATGPQVYASQTESWMNLTVRYLVGARERRRWASALVVALSEELARPEYSGRIRSGYPRTQLELIRPGIAGVGETGPNGPEALS